MKKAITFLTLAFALTGAVLAASMPVEKKPIAIEKPSAGKCHQPPQGPPGPQGPAGVSESTAFGSFYTTTPGTFDTNDTIPFNATLSNVNITHAADDEFTIQQAGYYYIHYGVSNTFTTETSNDTIITLAVNGTPVAGSRLAVPVRDELVTIGQIIPLQVGDVVRVQVVGSSFDMGVGTEGPVVAFIDFIRLAPIGVL